MKTTNEEIEREIEPVQVRVSAGVIVGVIFLWSYYRSGLIPSILPVASFFVERVATGRRRERLSTAVLDEEVLVKRRVSKVVWL